MADLSPAAQAVWDAFDQDVQEREAVAAVLRAAALYCIRDSAILMSLADELETP